jgi:hypothetical protein
MVLSSSCDSSSSSSLLSLLLLSSSCLGLTLISQQQFPMPFIKKIEDLNHYDVLSMYVNDKLNKTLLIKQTLTIYVSLSANLIKGQKFGR